MPTWDEITPETERWTRSSRLTCTNVLIGANIVGFAVAGLLPRIFGISVDGLAFEANRAIGRFEIWRFATYSLVQLVDFWFLFWFVFGAFTLYQIGNELEREIGPARYLGLYFGCAAYGAMMHAVYQYVSGSFAPALSFFGPVFAVVTAYAWRYPNRPILFFFFLPMRMRTSVLITAGILFFYCLIYFKAGLSPVAFLGAGLAALAVHYAGPAVDRWADARESRRERARMIEGIELKHRVDAILDKISREGMGALTRAERGLLKRASESMGRRPND